MTWARCSRSNTYDPSTFVWHWWWIDRYNNTRVEEKLNKHYLLSSPLLTFLFSAKALKTSIFFFALAFLSSFLSFVSLFSLFSFRFLLSFFLSFFLLFFCSFFDAFRTLILWALIGSSFSSKVIPSTIPSISWPSNSAGIRQNASYNTDKEIISQFLLVQRWNREVPNLKKKKI